MGILQQKLTLSTDSTDFQDNLSEVWVKITSPSPSKNKFELKIESSTLKGIFSGGLFSFWVLLSIIPKKKITQNFLDLEKKNLQWRTPIG